MRPQAPIRYDGPMPDTIELRHEASGPRHYLRGRPVPDGAALDLWLEDGTQVRGRYEQRAPGEATLVLWLRGGEPLAVTLPPSSRLSWPDARDGRRVERLEQTLVRAIDLLKRSDRRSEAGALVDEAQALGASREG